MNDVENLSPIPESSGPSVDEIALRAHQIWCEQGCPHGHDVDNWLTAERQLRSEYLTGQAPSTIPASEDVISSAAESVYGGLGREAPLASKVADQTLDAGRPESRNSPTSLDL